MENEEVVPVETLETPVEVVETPEVVVETVDERDTRIAELEEKNKKLFERAKKAEAEKKATPTSSLTSGDLLAVTNAKIHEDDIERVERFAKSEGLSIKEALKNPELNAVLDLRREQRNVADATNIGNVRAGSRAVPDEVLLANADKGKLPETDLEIERLIAAKTRASKA